jgi:hypothetical protein
MTTDYTNLIEQLDVNQDRFNHCQGYRAKPCIDGSFPSFWTLKYFAMSMSLRVAVVAQVEDIDKNVETYFLKFEAGDSLGLFKCIDECLFDAHATVVSGGAVVHSDGKDVTVKQFDKVVVPLDKPHSVTITKPTVFLVELRMKDFTNVGQ